MSDFFKPFVWRVAEDERWIEAETSDVFVRFRCRKVGTFKNFDLYEMPADGMVVFAVNQGNLADTYFAPSFGALATLLEQL
jgi:hypothetical protein